MAKRKQTTPRPPKPLIEAALPGAIECRFAAGSLDAEARTAEVVWTTGARVVRKSWDGPFIEELEVSPKAVRLDRLNSGNAPLLDTHDTYDLDSVIGVVLNASVKNGEGRAQVKFSERNDRAKAVFEGVREGVIGNVSVGYIIHKIEETEASEDAPAIRRAIDWEPLELSFVPIGADAGAGIRAKERAQPNDCVIVQRATSPTQEDLMARKGEQKSSGDEPENTRESELDLEGQDAEDQDDGGAKTRGAAKAPARKPAKKAEGEGGDVVSIDDARKAAREETRQIYAVCRKLGLEESEADAMIEEGLSLDEARARAIDRVAETASSNKIHSHVRTPLGGQDEVETRRELMGEALRHRANPKSVKLSDGARQYRGLNLVGLARECLEAQGFSCRGLTPMEIASFALNTTRAAGLHGTSDFPLILADVMHKELLRSYDEAPTTYREIARQTTASDFRTKHAITMGAAPALEATGEHGEFKRGTIGESEETYAVQTFGKIIGVTRQAIVNDNLDAFSTIPTRMGRAAARLEADTVIGLITSNPALSDTVAVFAAGHNNLTTGPGTAISAASIGVMRERMRKQTDLDGTTLINVVPRFIMVPAAKETLAEQTLSALVVPEAASNLTPPSMRSLTILVEARLDAVSTTAWYLFADPMEFDTLEYALLEGQEGPMVDRREGFDVDGLEIKIRHDFGAGWVSHRGAQKNDGA